MQLSEMHGTGKDKVVNRFNQWFLTDRYWSVLKSFHARDPELLPFKHTTCIPCWSYVETVVPTSFQRGIHVLCL